MREKESVSFSKVSKFYGCPMSYYLTYIEPPKYDEIEELVIPDTKDAMIGTYIQLCFESVINNKLFHKDSTGEAYIPDSLSRDIEADLYSLIKNRLSYKGGNTDNNEKLIVLNPCDKNFNTDTKIDAERLSNKIGLLFENNFNHLSSNYNLDNCVCEVPIRFETENTRLTGYADFVISDDRITILDGKLNKNLKYASPDQLEFYAWGIMQESEKQIDIGYINYVQAKTKMWNNIKPYSVPDTLEKFLEDLNSAKERGFRRTPFKYGEVKGHCKWCPEQNQCIYTRESIKEIDIEDYETSDVSDYL